MMGDNYVPFPGSQRTDPHKQQQNTRPNGKEPPKDEQSAVDKVLARVKNAWEHDEPDPRRWALGGWIPDGMITVLFGDGGMGKSYIALYIATLSCLGGHFGHLPLEKRQVLYLDAELDFEEFERRSYRVARGIGLERPPFGLRYYKLRDSIIKPEVQNDVAYVIEKLDIGMSILDSLSIAAFGASPTDAEDVIKAMKGLESWKTVLTLDHVSKPHAGSNQSHSTQFGSVFKRNIARSSIRLMKALGGGLSFQHDKANFGPLQSPLYFDMQFDADKVDFRFTDMKDDSMAGLTDHLPPLERVWHTMDAESDGKGSVTWLASTLGLSESTIRNYLTALKKQGRVVNESAGLWAVVRPAPEEEEWDVIY